METTGLNLLVADKADSERDAVAEAFARRGGAVHRIGRFWDPPAFPPKSVRVYGADSFCLVLQQKLGFDLCSPEDELLMCVPAQFLQRQLVICTLAEVSALPFPAFIKPVTPKEFRGGVYQSEESLAEECRGLTPGTKIFAAEPVRLTTEVRSFVMEGRVLDAAVYEGSGDAAEAKKFVNAVIQAVKIPRAVVIDVGFIAERGWAVIEFNAAWGAGLNGCNAEKTLPAIIAASQPVRF